MAEDLQYELSIEYADFVTGSRRAVKSLDDIDRASVNTDSSVKALNTTINKATQAILGFVAAEQALGKIKEAIGVQVKFAAAVSELGSITGAAGEDLKFYSDAAKEFGSTSSKSASEAVEAFKLIASAAPQLLESRDALKEVTQQALTLSEAAGISLPQAASALTSSLNQFDLSADNSADIINILAAAAKEGASEIVDTVAVLKDAGVVSANANVSFIETNAAIQALAKGMIKGAEAGTGLRNIITILETSTDKALRPSIVGLSGAIDNLSKRNLNATQMVKMFGRENITAASVLIKFRGEMDRVAGAIGGTNEAFRQAADNANNLDGDIKALGSAYESLQIRIGELGGDELRAFTQSLTTMTQAMAGNESAMEEWSGIIDGVGIAAQATATVIASKLVTSLVSLTASRVSNTAANIRGVMSEKALAEAEVKLLIIQKQAHINTIARTKSDRVRDAVRTQLTKTTAALAVAETRLATASKAADFAAKTAVISMTSLKTAMSFLGGPLGVALLAAGAIYEFSKATEESRPKTKNLGDEVSKLAGEFEDLNDAQRKGLLIQLNREMSKAREQIIATSGQMDILKNSLGTLDPGGRAVAIKRIEQLEDRITSYKNALIEVSAKQQAIFQGGLDLDLSSIKDTPRSILKVKDEILSLNSQLQSLDDASLIVATNRLSYLEGRVNRYNELLKEGGGGEGEETVAPDTKVQEFMDSLFSTQSAEMQAIDDHETLKLERLMEFRNAGKIQEEEYSDALLAITDDTERRRAAIIAKTEKEKANTIARGEAQVTSMRMQNAQRGISIVKMFAGESRAAALASIVLQQGLAAAQMVMNTKVASMRAMAELGPIAGAPVAAAIETQGAIGLGLIAAQGIAQASTIGGSGSSGAGGVGSSIASSAPSQPTAAPQQEAQAIRLDIHVTGDSDSKMGFAIAEVLNESIAEGAQIMVNQS